MVDTHPQGAPVANPNLASRSPPPPCPDKDPPDAPDATPGRRRRLLRHACCGRFCPELRLPDAILPKYADFVYQVLLHAVKFCAHTHWLDRADQACLFCPELETYRHFLVDCDFIHDVWATLESVTAPLGVALPTTLVGILFSTPKTAHNSHQAAFGYLWPVLRACVWFNVWRVQNDRVFRSDLPLPSPWTIAIKAARVTQLHLHHSFVQDPEQPGLLQLLRLLAQHEWPRQHLVRRISLTPPPA
ncbi:hypothetical protein THRCLA_20476 [Thraustotheca clavata]|uniref:Reverse transcriptase zinc-binding domain-containing protein n=1 Tax=Thraustotheca clavata TaxID=74557 RepID=A0A1W0A6S1_9STRA|nr:hypothetical protein THRCLA_20476 [Thraustotheca clavata]